VQSGGVARWASRRQIAAMGFCCSWIASECSATQLEQAVAEAFPDFEVVERLEAPRRSDFIKMDERVRSTTGQALIDLAFYDDGSRGVCVDGSLTMTVETDGLARLSELVGPTLVLYIATQSGCAGFELFREGRSVRKVDSTNGDLAVVGEPLKEESGLPRGRFYMDEVNAIWAAFGMKRPPGDWEQEVSLVLYRDHACEQDLDERIPGWRNMGQRTKPARPWWKFW
jgi:hypothetical protein